MFPTVYSGAANNELRGGKVVATGSPEEIAASAQSYTGHFLKKLLSSK